MRTDFIKCYLKLLRQKEKKKRSSNLNLASLFLISSILFYLDHHFRITVRSTDEQNCISWNPGTQQTYNHSTRPVKQPPFVFRSLTDHPSPHLVHQLTSIGLHGKEGDNQQHRQTNHRALLN